MEESKLVFPHLQRSIADFLNDEEGNIPRNKVLAIGSMMIVLGVLFADNALAAHRSHSSHRSHTSSRGGGSTRSSYHESHQSHQSHQSHTSSTGGGHSNSAPATHRNTGASTHSNSGSGNTLRLIENNTSNTAPVTRSLPATQELSVGWQHDNIGWWWRNADGSFPFSTWKWLDGNHDGIYENYCFDSRGYLYTDTVTPDGYTVNSNGAWVQNGVVQTK